MTEATETKEHGRGRGMLERVVAETELMPGVKYRVIREEVGDYCLEYTDRGLVSRDSGWSLSKALAEFVEAAQEAEAQSYWTDEK
jgi:hypothetical protein